MNIKLLSTAKLISDFKESIELGDLYERGARCHETLLDIIKDPKTADDVANISKRTPAEVQSAAEQIIDRMLFNRGGDPYIVLGLSEGASSKDAKKSRNRLLSVYHPDRFPDTEALAGERTRLINRAYNEVLAHPSPLQEALSKEGEAEAASKTESFVRYLRPLPALVISLAVIVAAVSVTKFSLSRLRDSHEKAPVFAPEEKSKVRSTPSEPLSEDTVREFLESYRSHYESGDVDAFMSLFSKDATENGLPVSFFEDSYRHSFRNTTRAFRIENVSIDIHGDSTADILAEFELVEADARGERSNSYSGMIKWTVRNVGGELKIVRMVYD